MPKRDLACRNAGPCSGFASDHDTPELLRSGGVLFEGRPRLAGQPGTVSRVDDDLCLHRLTARSIDHHDAGGITLGVLQNVRGAASVEEHHSGLEERVVQRSLDLHRGRVRHPAGLVGEPFLGLDLDFAQ